VTIVKVLRNFPSGFFQKFHNPANAKVRIGSNLLPVTFGRVSEQIE